ncbi:hypothetical protein GCM10009733_066400 [Nonomuraea maheshkhaliensis]|uniref:Uncharacterized protein n=1 Tax=Nonomuraea maheshkhaliensis TaxID=419590 RepID=A0ABN2FTX1_9ACTN
MYPDLYLYVERARGRELRAEAERHRQCRRRRRAEGRAEGRGSLVRGLETRLGWALVEAGLRLVHRRAVDY